MLRLSFKKVVCRFYKYLFYKYWLRTQKVCFESLRTKMFIECANLLYCVDSEDNSGRQNWRKRRTFFPDLRTGRVADRLRGAPRSSSGSLRNDPVVIQFDSDIRRESHRRWSGVVRGRPGGTIGPLSKRCLVSLLQGSSWVDARQSWGVRQVVHAILEESGSLASVPSSVLLGTDVGALCPATVGWRTLLCEFPCPALQLVAHHLSLPKSSHNDDEKTRRQKQRARHN